jgi:putative sterol carrier protein
MYSPFTQPWADAFRTVINASESYRTAARSWLWSTSLVCTADPTLGIPVDVAIELALDRGVCHAAIAKPADESSAEFFFRAPMATWQLVLSGQLDPITGVTKGSIKTNGPLTTLLLQMKAASALVACAQQVPTRFPDALTTP